MWSKNCGSRDTRKDEVEREDAMVREGDLEQSRVAVVVGGDV